ncbi:hypothetical protein MTR67_026055, partial [Solanum verrucosum]
PSPLHTTTIVDKCTVKLVDEFNHMLYQATEPLSTFLEYIRKACSGEENRRYRRNLHRNSLIFSSSASVLHLQLSSSISFGEKLVWRKSKDVWRKVSWRKVFMNY